MQTPEPASDAELIARVRAGDLDAYGELFGRHHEAAERMARQLVPANDADDLAGDAFARVLDALRSGSGPDLSFRAYLLTTVRRVHVDRFRSGRRIQPTGDIAAYERDPQEFEDPTVTGFESGAAAKAFASLPERWQAVLWHTEVEGEKPAAVAPLLGLTPNGVSALAYRAREGLRQAYLQQHLADVAGHRCGWTTERLGAYVRGGLTKRENHDVREHLDGCARCTAVYLELVEVNSALPALLAPILLGTAGGGYVAATSGAPAGLAGLMLRGWESVTENTARAAASAVTAATVVITVVLAVLVIGSDGADPPAAIKDPGGGSRQPGAATTPTMPTMPTMPTTSSTTTPPRLATPTERTSPPSVTTTQRPSRPMAHDSVPVPHRTAGRSTGSTGDPSTGRNGVPGAEPTRRPTARPTATLTSEPATDPDPAPTRPPESTTPVLDERLLTITSYGDGNGGPATRSAVPAAVTAPAEQRLLTLTVPANSTEPLTVELGYGARLGWPVGPNPAGWSCLRKAGGAGGTCTATTPGKPKVLRLKFAMPTGGSAAHRTFTVAARSGRLHDQDSETLVARRRPDHSPPRISRPRPADGPRRFPYNRVPLRGAAAGRYVATSPTPPRPASRFGGPGSLA